MTKKAEEVRILHHHDRPYHVMAGLLTVLFTVAFLVGCTGSESPKQPAQQEVPSATAREEEETRAETEPAFEADHTAPSEPAFEAEHPAPSEPTFEAELPAPSEPVVPPENQETASLRISTPEALQEELYAAIRAVRQPAPMDISGVTLSENPEIDVKNLYYSLTSHVKYDHRYTSDPEHLPYDTRTAIGALRDGLAICGGYAHALKLLFEQAGIPCRTVTGSYYRENHMWNMAWLDGAWLWFDATADRGVSPAFGFRHFAQEELDPTQYRWEPEQVALLLRLDAAHP